MSGSWQCSGSYSLACGRSVHRFASPCQDVYSRRCTETFTILWLGLALLFSRRVPEALRSDKGHVAEVGQNWRDRTSAVFAVLSSSPAPPRDHYSTRK